MEIKTQQKITMAGRCNNIDGPRDKIAGFFVGLALCILLLGSVGIACAVEGHDAPNDAAASGKKPDEKGKGPEQADKLAEKIVVARVNGAAITKRSLDLMIGQIQSESDAQETGGNEKRQAAVYREKALDRLIFQELVFQKALKEGFKTTKEDIEAVLGDIKAKGGGEEAFRNRLKEISRTENEIRAAVERSLITEGFYKREISDKVHISEKALKAEYERNRDKFVIPEVVTVIDVVFFLDINDNASFKRAEEIRAKIASAPDKDPTTTLEPDGTFIVRELGIKKDRDQELYKEALKLKEGEISDVFKTKDSLHILILKKYAPEKQVQFEQVRSLIESKLKSQAKQEMVRKWEQELKKVAVIEIMPQENEK